MENKFVDEFLDHYGSEQTPDSDCLQHYGVPGMKWGVRKARRKAAKEGVSGRSRLSTGKHYDEVHKQLQKDAEPLNKKYKSQYTKLMDDGIELTAKQVPDFKKMSQKDFHAKYDPLWRDFENRNRQLNEEYYREKITLVEKYVDKFNEATLKDINYRDVEKGVNYLKKKKAFIFDVDL